MNESLDGIIVGADAVDIEILVEKDTPRMIEIGLDEGGCKTNVRIDMESRRVMLRHVASAGGAQIVCEANLPPMSAQCEAAFRKIALAESARDSLDKTTPEYRHLAAMPRRAAFALRQLMPRIRQIAPWLAASRETTNFTYDLTPANRKCLSHTVAVAADADRAMVERYMTEAEQDQRLAVHITRRVAGSPDRWKTDEQARFGRRLAWYAMARLRKPGLIVETGVDKGLGAVLLCSALARNSDEGHPGSYVGIDINPAAGHLLAPPYNIHGRVLNGDAIEQLGLLDRPIDLYINDSDHSADYERREYAAIRERLAPNAIVLGDNAHRNDVLMDFADSLGKRFLLFREDPADHWYPGAGVGIAY